MEITKRKRNYHKLIDGIVGVMSFIMFAYYVNVCIQEMFFGQSALFFILILVVTALVHVLKAIRLFIILLGENFDKKEFVLCYIRTSIVNLLLPFKSGELYRGYSFGKLIGSYSTGYIMVLFDRFVDTLALIMFIIGAGFVEGFKVTLLYIALTIFLLLAILLYWAFKPLYQYWNHFLIFRKSSQHTLGALKFLQLCKQTYESIQNVVKGKFAIIFGMSLLAWGGEIFGMMCLGRSTEIFGISDYLNDIMRGQLPMLNIAFLLVSILFLSMVRIGLKIKTERFRLL